MQPVIPPLYILHPDPVLHELLDRVPGRTYYVVPVADWSALADALQRSSPMAVAVVDPGIHREDPAAPAETLRRLLESYPSSTVVAALPVRGQDSVVLQTLRDWGVADVLDLIRERTPDAVARRLRVVQGRTPQRVLARALPGSVSGRTRALLGVAAETVARGGMVPELARALDVTERTVARWHQQADLPPPRRVLVWLRLLLAADLLDNPGRSLEAVARGCGYAGGASLKATLRAVLRMTPRELRAEGAFRTTVQRFQEELWGIREEALRQPKPDRVWLT